MKNLVFVVLFFISINSFAQKTNNLYLEFVSKTMHVPYYAKIYIQQCNSISTNSIYTNPQKASFEPIYLKCDSSKPAQLMFTIPGYTGNYNRYNGDLQLYSGDSVIYNVDKANFTVINKDRPSRSTYTDCDCHSPE